MFWLFRLFAYFRHYLTLIECVVDIEPNHYCIVKLRHSFKQSIYYIVFVVFAIFVLAQYTELYGAFSLLFSYYLCFRRLFFGPKNVYYLSAAASRCYVPPLSRTKQVVGCFVNKPSAYFALSSCFTFYLFIHFVVVFLLFCLSVGLSTFSSSSICSLLYIFL